jgi:prepilin-type N-terminal cleavage/methylation domain-containing protein
MRKTGKGSLFTRHPPPATRHFSAAFTLVELLVVVAIMTILVAILLPGIAAVRNAAKKNKARTDVAALLHAFKGYYNEYAKWPGNLNDYANWPAKEDDVEATINGIEVNDSVIKMLAGQNLWVGPGKNEPTNPREKVFLAVPPESLVAGGYVDPWGNPYKYMLDFNYDNSVDLNFSNFSGKTNLPNTMIAIWSRGKDKSDENGRRGDDIASWQ